MCQPDHRKDVDVPTCYLGLALVLLRANLNLNGWAITEVQNDPLGDR
jgi:hypothetical protein